MAKRGVSTYKGTGVNAAAGSGMAKAPTPGTAKAKPSAKAVTRASSNAAFKRTGPVKVNAAKAKATAPKSMQSPDARSASNRASGARTSNVPGTYGYRPPDAIDPGKFFGEVVQNIRNLPGVSDLQRASGGIPSGAQSKKNNDALKRALNRR